MSCSVEVELKMLETAKIGSSEVFLSGKQDAHGAQATVDQQGGTAFHSSLTNLIFTSMNYIRWELDQRSKTVSITGRDGFGKNCTTLMASTMQ